MNRAVLACACKQVKRVLRGCGCRVWVLRNRRIAADNVHLDRRVVGENGQRATATATDERLAQEICSRRGADALRRVVRSPLPVVARFLLVLLLPLLRPLLLKRGQEIHADRRSGTEGRDICGDNRVELDARPWLL